MENLPKRKPNRLKAYDYSRNGAYFITVCVKKRKNLLCRIVGGDALDAPKACLTAAGVTVEKYIRWCDGHGGITIDKYVIMPNHVHILLFVDDAAAGGPSRASAPTQHAAIPQFVSTWKRMCGKELGGDIFQRSYHDHVIRGEADYLKIWEYIDTNPIKWKEDCFYNEEEARYE